MGVWVDHIKGQEARDKALLHLMQTLDEMRDLLREIRDRLPSDARGKE